MSLGNGTRSVPPSHIEIVAESLCGWACLREYPYWWIEGGKWAWLTLRIIAQSPTFKTTRHIGNPNFACIELTNLCFILYNVTNRSPIGCYNRLNIAEYVRRGDIGILGKWHVSRRGRSESNNRRSGLSEIPAIVLPKKIELREDLKSRRGLAVSLEIICHNCEESTSTMSSKISNKCYDVNLRLTYGMRAIGKGGACCSNILWAHEFASTTCKV
ncbi:hypothetical protein TNCV_4249781 [Trichonephila clavipes]|nr:hypothetical protein TNCV_4249781 [Trichonephila clavipes]